MILYGFHTCAAALANPQRRIHNIYVTNEKVSATLAERLGDSTLLKRIPPQIVTTKFVQSLVGEDAVHQGLVVKTDPLPAIDLHTHLESCDTPVQTVLLLDQVVDPHNIGAILRSCAVFGVTALVVMKQKSPHITPALAKVASGALEHIPLCEVTNLTVTLHDLKQRGFWCVGLSERGETSLSQFQFAPKTAIVLGSEGMGIRRLVADNCDVLLNIPSAPNFCTLNVSNAAAIVLHHVFLMNGSTLNI